MTAVERTEREHKEFPGNFPVKTKQHSEFFFLANAQKHSCVNHFADEKTVTGDREDYPVHMSDNASDAQIRNEK
ncbi:hypothetical protein TNCT_131481 [Trichonephila clavata]|uniref:Uncharacterized protein n=1 Tax=Trichonephila clavata TaxID=2740835 RepID=A0A8X6GNX7_TRICU|nr:hypothetical protein TNCT_131481 [Trichonephila clavata]